MQKVENAMSNNLRKKIIINNQRYRVKVYCANLREIALLEKTLFGKPSRFSRENLKTLFWKIKSTLASKQIYALQIWSKTPPAGYFFL